ncbi:MAG: CDP-alcohol phosphatidyltransferase family protein [Planctomycetota bacterium]
MNDPLRRRRLIYVLALTVARVPLAAAFAVFFLLFPGPESPAAFVCFGLLLLLELTDLLDGALARRWGVASEAGAALDPYADSMSRLIVFWTFAMRGLVLSAVPLVMALRDVTVAYCRIALVGRGRTVAARWSGKLKAVVQGGTALLLITVLAFARPAMDRQLVVVVSWVVIVATVASALEYARAALATEDRPSDTQTGDLP